MWIACGTLAANSCHPPTLYRPMPVINAQPQILMVLWMMSAYATPAKPPTMVKIAVTKPSTGHGGHHVPAEQVL